MQLKAHEMQRRFRVLAWGRQSGKSTWGNNEIIRHTWLNRGHIYWFILPTYKQARIQYRRAKSALYQCPGAVTRHSDSELSMTLLSGSTVFYQTGEKPENLRAETLNGVVIDEYRKQKPELWPMVIRSMLGTTKGWAAFTSTTNGFDEFYELYEKARTDTTGEWGCLQAPSTCNPLFTNEELEACKKDMSFAQFQQEIMAEFVNLGAGKAYHAYSEDNIRETNPFTEKDSYSEYLPIVVGMDFNLSPMAWCLGQQNRMDWYWREEIFLENSYTLEAAKELVERVKNHKKGVIFCGDATAKAGQRAAAGQSDYDILCKTLTDAGVKWQNKTPESNPNIKDRLNAVNAKLRDANGDPHMWHHPRCEKLRRDLTRVTVKPGANFTLDPGPEMMLTHISDAIGYPIAELTPVPSIFTPGVARVIVR